MNVFQRKENRNSVSLLAKADSSEAFEKIFMAEEVQKAMKEGGVISKPEISWLDCVE